MWAVFLESMVKVSIVNIFGLVAPCHQHNDDTQMKMSLVKNVNHFILGQRYECWWFGAVLNRLQLVGQQQSSRQPKPLPPGLSHKDDKQMKMVSPRLYVSHFYFWSPWFKSALWILKAWCSACLAPWHQHDDNTQVKMLPATWEPFCFGSMI